MQASPAGVWGLEGRGIQITLDKEDDLLVAPREQLTDEDRTGIRQHKGEIVSLVRLCDELVT